MRRRQPRPTRPRRAWVWVTLSLLLAVIGIAVIVLTPSPVSSGSVQAEEPLRFEDPLADAQPPAPEPSLAPVPESTTAPPPSTSSPSARTTTPSTQAAAFVWPDLPPMPASTPVRVTIPVLGVRSPVTGLGLNPDGSMQIPEGGRTVGWYDGSPTPGELGPAVLVGHVDWAGEHGAFWGLRVLRPGDRIVVDRADGTTATFRVGRVERHAKDDFPTAEVYGDVGWSALRLITCGGRFSRGNYVDNIVVFARLVSTG